MVAKARPLVDTHCTEITPPGNGRDTWLVVCSFKDFSRSYANRLEAIIAASEHTLAVVTMSELEQGSYQFDDTPLNWRE